MLSDAIGDALVAMSKWVVAITESSYLGVSVLLVLLAVVLVGARWVRWDHETRKRDASRRRHVGENGYRPDDV